MKMQALGYVFLLFLDSFRGPAADGQRTGTGPRTTTLSSTALAQLVLGELIIFDCSTQSRASHYEPTKQPPKINVQSS